MTTTPARATAAIFAVFLAHGLLLGAWVPHIALAQERLAAGPAVFGLALLSIAAGAVIAMPISGMEINRFGSRNVALLTGLTFALMVLLPMHAPSLALFIPAGLALGAAIGSMDVAMNAHGIAVEKQYGKPIMSRLHGGFSLGGLLGAAAAAWLLPRIGATAHGLLAAGVALAMLAACRPFLLSSDVDRGLSGTHFAWPTRTTIGLGMLCFLALMSEGAVLDWSTIYFRDKFAIDAATAGMSYALFSGGMAASRLSGDWVRFNFGAVRMVVVSALLTAAAIVLGLWAGSYPMALVAFTLTGIGIGNIAPVLFAGGGRLEPDAPGRGIAAVTTLGYSGFLAGPPLIGFIAEGTSLGNALLAIVAASLIIAAFARKVAAADTY
jgi:MFS family permease